MHKKRVAAPSVPVPLPAKSEARAAYTEHFASSDSSDSESDERERERIAKVSNLIIIDDSPELDSFNPIPVDAQYLPPSAVPSPATPSALYSHIASKDLPPAYIDAEPMLFESEPRERPLCRFHILGNCKFGTLCRDVHGLPCSECGKPALHPTSQAERASIDFASFAFVDFTLIRRASANLRSTTRCGRKAANLSRHRMWHLLRECG
jgi:hypothetical protein